MDDSDGVIPYEVVIGSNTTTSNNLIYTNNTNNTLGVIYTSGTTINANWRYRVIVRIPKALIKYPKLFKSDSILGELYRKHLRALMGDTEEVYPDEI